jgi:phosphatidylglycerol:prolipoprotein diacylglycerol transferase
VPDPPQANPPASHYVHDLDPFVFRLGDDFGPRWYGVAYVLGFFLAIALLKALARHGRFVLPPTRVADFVTYAFLFGVFVGGRLGYFLLYAPGTLARDPLVFFRVLDGGMASHGGVAGLALYTLYYALRHRVPWTALGDGLVVAAPIGVFFGRLANFINGELYGHRTRRPWGVIFPESARDLDPGDPAMRALQDELWTAEPSLAQSPDWIGDAVALSRDSPALQAAFARHLEPRHPSQLYEAALEGAVLFAILLAVRVRYKNLPDGLLTGLFFVLYGVFRISVEQFRQPDAALIAGLTRGQFYSLFMLVAGAAFLASAWRKAQVAGKGSPAA